MKRFSFVVSLLLGAIPGAVWAGSWEPPYGPPLVVMGHDREPAGQRESGIKDTAPTDNECNEQHHLQPDGDHDCDDPVSVAEPGTVGLLALGLGGLALIWRRRR